MSIATPHALSHAFRHGNEIELRRRRGVVALALTSCAAMGFISLYQMGILPHLPSPPLPMLDSDKVDASDESYSMFATPDSLLGLTNYSITALLAARGSQNRSTRRPWLCLGLAGKLLVDTGFAIRLLVRQPLKFKAWCFWCLVAAGSTFASLPLILPETLQALRSLRQRERI